MKRICIHLSRFFFRIIRKYLSQEAVNFFTVTHVYSSFIAFPYIMPLYTLVTLFFQNHQKIFVPKSGQFFHRHTCIQWFHSFSLYNAFVYTCHAFFFRIVRKYLSQEAVNFFIVTLVYSGFIVFPFIMHCIHLSQFFFQNHQIFSHRHTCKQWLHSFSLYNAFVYTCHAFLVLHQKLFVPYIILCTARLSLFHTVSLFSPLKYIVYRCYSCFRQRRGHFFHCYTCIQWLHSFSLYNAFVYTCHAFLVLHQKIFVPYIILCTARLSLFHTVSLFSPLKYIVCRCYSCFRQRRGHFFSSSHLYTVVA